MKRAVAIATLLPVGLLGCSGGGQQEQTNADTTAISEPMAESAGGMEMGMPVLTARLMPSDSASGISGTVRIYQGAGAGEDTAAAQGAARSSAQTAEGFSVEVVATGLPPGEHAWHIHSGPCSTDGPVVVPFTPTATSKGIGQALTADAAGAAQGMGTVPASSLSLGDLLSGQYSLHVHQEAGVEHGPTIACANLARGEAGTPRPGG